MVREVFVQCGQTSLSVVGIDAEGRFGERRWTKEMRWSTVGVEGEEKLKEQDRLGDAREKEGGAGKEV